MVNCLARSYIHSTVLLSKFQFAKSFKCLISKSFFILFLKKEFSSQITHFKANFWENEGEDFNLKCDSILAKFYISHALSNFYGTEIEIWAGFGLVGLGFVSVLGL